MKTTWLILPKRAPALVFGLTLFLACSLAPPAAADYQARVLVQAAVNYYRGNASSFEVEMTVNRPTWKRTYLIRGWTRGRQDSIFFIVAPPKDRGNGTLKLGRNMWTYNPKVNRVIKLPPSMMSQAWMGSDFSNNDLAKSDSILEDYTHEILEGATHQGKKLFVIRSVPKPDAPVIWGMQRLFIREDHILVAEEFYDEDMQLVKAMTGSRLEILGGRLFPRVWKMQKAGFPDHYTRLFYQRLQFHDSLPANLFSLSALRRSWR